MLTLSLRPYRPRRAGRTAASLANMPPAQPFENWLSAWVGAFRDRTPFTSSSALTGKGPAQAWAIGTGRLPADWERTFRTRRNVGCIDYVVLSYDTPIAWHDTEAGWVVPEEKYSITTSKHQSHVGHILAVLGEPVVSA